MGREELKGQPSPPTGGTLAGIGSNRWKSPRRLRKRQNKASLLVAPLNLPYPPVLLVEQEKHVDVQGRRERKAPGF